MLKHVWRLARNAVRDVSAPRLRSTHWPSVEHHWLACHPACEACGGTSNLNVHHVVPFHVDPTRELDETNFITLCMSKDHHCHLLLGHGDSFRSYNENVRQDVAAYRAAVDAAEHHVCDAIVTRARLSRKT